MNKFMDALNNGFAPKAQKVANNEWILTIKNSILQILPFIFVGSLITLLGIPTNFWDWWPDLSPISSFTFGLTSIFVAFLFPYNLMERKKLNKQKIIAGLSSVVLFLMLANPTWDKTNSIISYQFSELGAGGMFVALVVGVFVAIIMGAFGKFSFFGEDTSLPDFVIAWFDSMLPIMTVIGVGWILTYLIHFDIYQLVVSAFSPLSNSLDTWWGFTLFLFFDCFIYSMGISGWVLAAIDQPIMFAGIANNAQQFAHGQAITHVFTSEVIYSFPWIGGVGCTMPLILMMLLWGKSKRLKALGKACIVPSIFNINEPLVFGTIVWNPYLMLPLWINGIVLPLITVSWFKLGLSPIPHSLMQMWYIPFPFVTWIVSPAFSAILLLLILFVVGGLIYYPFFKVYDKNLVKEEG
ncbi:PTS sugar transporter subunit IIC [Pediococcus pentosaceus]|uniref:PTS sugar transporter subunit IIC n=1 Tax=Pediococcus pentosaceus TaxID=1255 RepID=UPI001323711E|nr:PTS transporter subunit EIIC [Pediococcus pentosaceus]KAF0522871.1 PTS sugar transporter subunit IIC [Pediococcus pentosaceus]